MPWTPGALRANLRAAADTVADYLENIERYPVLPRVKPGEVAAALAPSAPDEGEAWDAILADYRRWIEPNVTHWNSPGFLAYIAITGSGPGIAGELLAAGLNVNAMLWRTAPAAVELEERVCDWVRQWVGLPEGFVGHINDTASIGVLLALAAARHRATPEVRERGVSGPPQVVYTSDQAHSSVDKAAITLGLGLAQVRRLPSDAAFRLDPGALSAAVAADRAAGLAPLAVVATAGTTSTGSLDPLASIARVAEREGLWLHVDAAYGGGAAICPEVRARLDGIERADSVVINPHKWLFTPVDCSLLFVRDPRGLKATFSLVPEYLRTPEQGVTNPMDYGPQLGRRFRALKLWMVLRSYGRRGLSDAIREHLRLARTFAGWVDADPRFERVAPVELGIVAFRYRGDDAANLAILDQVNADGRVFLSHSVLGGRTVLRVVVGNARTEERHLATAWDLIRAAAEG